MCGLDVVPNELNSYSRCDLQLDGPIGLYLYLAEPEHTKCECNQCGNLFCDGKQGDM